MDANIEYTDEYVKISRDVWDGWFEPGARGDAGEQVFGQTVLVLSPISSKESISATLDDPEKMKIHAQQQIELAFKIFMGALPVGDYTRAQVAEGMKTFVLARMSLGTKVPRPTAEDLEKIKTDHEGD